MKLSNKIIASSLILIPISLNFFTDFNKKITVITLVIVSLSFLFYFGKENFVFDIFFRLFENSSKFILLIILFLTTLITQNIGLQYETLDWDVHSYLVMALDIDRGFLPLENQWESKGPVLFYLYNILYKLSFQNFVYFKVINDLIIFFISLLILSSRSITNNNLVPFANALFFILMMSQPWALSEYSEIYSLFFLAIGNYLIFKNKLEPSNLFLIALCLSISTLINQGTVLFVVSLFIYIIFKKDYLNKNNYFYIILGLIIPHLCFLILYFYKNLINVYFDTFVNIPLGYTGASVSSARELIVFLRSFYHHDIYLFTGIIFLISLYILETINNRFSNLKIHTNQYILINLITSLLFYFIGSHNYYHHLFFLIFYLSFLPITLKSFQIKKMFLIFIIFSSLVINIRSFQTSSSNLKNITSLIENYPMYQASLMIENNFNSDFSVLALDYVSVLHYLNKENFSYIIHPSNHFEPYIADTLININLIRDDEINKLILENPDVIICSGRRIVKGEVTKNKFYNCAISDWNKKYRQVNTEIYKENPYLNFYNDPYRDISIFFRKS